VSLNGQDFSVADTNSWFTFYQPPNITLMHPLSGPSTGSTVVSIGGQGVEFVVHPSLPTCRFGRNLRDMVQFPGMVSHATKLPGRAADRTYAYTCSVPNTKQIGPIMVEFALNGQDYRTYSGPAFTTYVSANAQGLTPSSGLHTGGYPVTIIGVDFRLLPSKRKLQCRFQNDPRSVKAGKNAWLVVPATFIDATHLKCTVPKVIEPIPKDGNGRTAQLQFTLNGQDWRAAANFLYKPLPICYTCVREDLKKGGPLVKPTSDARMRITSHNKSVLCVWTLSILYIMFYW